MTQSLATLQAELLEQMPAIIKYQFIVFKELPKRTGAVDNILPGLPYGHLTNLVHWASSRHWTGLNTQNNTMHVKACNSSNTLPGC